MSHYTIDLSGNIKLDIRKGKVFKMNAGASGHWPLIKLRSEAKTGYIVTLENVLQKIKAEYHLLKTKEGAWLAGELDELSTAVKVQGKWQPLAENLTTLSIKKAIDDYESKQ